MLHHKSSGCCKESWNKYSETVGLHYTGMRLVIYNWIRFIIYKHGVITLRATIYEGVNILGKRAILHEKCMANTIINIRDKMF